MKKIYIALFLVCSTFMFSQKEKKTTLIQFYPDFRCGIQAPLFFGNNFFAKDFNSTVGFQSTLSLIKVKNFRFTLGFDVQKLNLTNTETIGNFSNAIIKTTSIMIEYEKKINEIYTISPTISIGYNDINFRKNGIIASQHGNELKVGAYVSRNLDKTFAAFAGLHYANHYNDNIKASPQQKDYFAQSNKIVLSIGIQIH